MLPPGVLDALVPPAGCEAYLEAFWSLNAGRQFAGTMAMVIPCGLPYTDIRQYVLDVGLADTPEELLAVVRLIQAMDLAFVDATIEKLSEKT